MSNPRLQVDAAGGRLLDLGGDEALRSGPHLLPAARLPGPWRLPRRLRRGGRRQHRRQLQGRRARRAVHRQRGRRLRRCRGLLQPLQFALQRRIDRLKLQGSNGFSSCLCATESIEQNL